jgi:hypothetical protein
VRTTLLISLATSLAAYQPALAQDGALEASDPPEVYRQLMDCRAIADDAQRLACYDRRTQALDVAARSRDVIISDKNALKEVRRGLFGFAAPIGKLMGFGGDGTADEEEVKEIETTVLDATRIRAGWRLYLADGSTWEQNDTRDFVLSPKVGNPVRISRGALGTYFVSVKGQRAIRMRRVK